MLLQPELLYQMRPIQHVKLDDERTRYQSHANPRRFSMYSRRNSRRLVLHGISALRAHLVRRKRTTAE